MTAPGSPRWRQVFDAAERQVTPRADRLVRTDTFAVGAALLRRAHGLTRSSAQGLTARAWHLLNLPAGSDVNRLRTQIGALDREVRRLTVQLESGRRHPAARPAGAADPPRPDPPEHPDHPQESHADGAQPPEPARPGPA